MITTDYFYSAPPVERARLMHVMGWKGTHRGDPITEAEEMVRENRRRMFGKRPRHARRLTITEQYEQYARHERQNRADAFLTYTVGGA